MKQDIEYHPSGERRVSFLSKRSALADKSEETPWIISSLRSWKASQAGGPKGYCPIVTVGKPNVLIS